MPIKDLWNYCTDICNPLIAVLVDQLAYMKINDMTYLPLYRMTCFQKAQHPVFGHFVPKSLF